MSTTLLVFIAAVIAAVAAGILARGRRARRRSATLPPLVFDVHDAEAREVRPASFRHAEPAAGPPAAGTAARRWPTPSRPSGETRVGGGRRDPSRDTPIEASPHQSAARAPYFPGTLEIQSASHRGELIRFPRARAGRAWFTLGRDSGDPATHIVLPADTVSGRHARMEFHDGRWRITNLSRTHPTMVNGVALTDESGGRWLADGDQLMMGELLLVFRQ